MVTVATSYAVLCCEDVTRRGKAHSLRVGVSGEMLSGRDEPATEEEVQLDLGPSRQSTLQPVTQQMIGPPQLSGLRLLQEASAESRGTSLWQAAHTQSLRVPPYGVYRGGLFEQAEEPGTPQQPTLYGRLPLTLHPELLGCLGAAPGQPSRRSLAEPACSSGPSFAGHEQSEHTRLLADNDQRCSHDGVWDSTFVTRPYSRGDEEEGGHVAPLDEHFVDALDSVDANDERRETSNWNPILQVRHQKNGVQACAAARISADPDNTPLFFPSSLIFFPHPGSRIHRKMVAKQSTLEKRGASGIGSSHEHFTSIARVSVATTGASVS